MVSFASLHHITMGCHSSNSSLLVLKSLKAYNATKIGVGKDGQWGKKKKKCLVK
jgi:hypothetical protein